jgi:hypothetical protein
MKIVSPNWLMELASTETICPSQTTINANIPLGRLEEFSIKWLLKTYKVYST